MAKVTVTLDIAEGVDPFSVLTTRPKRAKVRAFRELLKKLDSGSFARSITRPTLKVGTAQASCTATLVSPVATNHLDINGKALTAIQLHARATVTFVSAVAGNTVVINGVTFTGTAGAVVAGAATFSIDTSDTATAASLAAQVNAYGGPLIAGLITATSAAGVTTLRSVATGTAGNAYTLTKVGAPITVTGSGFLAGGVAPTGDQWDYGDTDTQAATALANCINRSTTALVANLVEATAALGVVTIRAAKKGLGGNAIAVARTGAPITLAGLTSGLMTGGTETTLTF